MRQTGDRCDKDEVSQRCAGKNRLPDTPIGAEADGRRRKRDEVRAFIRMREKEEGSKVRERYLLLPLIQVSMGHCGDI